MAGSQKFRKNIGRGAGRTSVCAGATAVAMGTQSLTYPGSICLTSSPRGSLLCQNHFTPL